MTLGRTRRDEQRLGDLAVAEALAGELGDTALAGCERVEPAEHDPARTRTGGAQLGLGVVGEGSCASSVSGVECLAQQFPRLGATVAAPEHRAEVGEGTRSFQPRVAALEGLDRVAEQGRSAVTAGHDAGGTQRDGQCARGAERPGELELLFCQAFSRLVIAQRELSERLGISFSGAKSRVQRARAKIKEQLLACCHFQLDYAGHIVDYWPHCGCDTPGDCDD